MRDTLRLVIADSNEDLRFMVEDAVCGEKDITVVASVGDGAEALDAVVSARPDVLLMDLLLPKIDGLSVLEQLHRMHRKPEVVIESGFMSDMIARKCSELGVSIILTKPCELELMIERVKFAYEYSREIVGTVDMETEHWLRRSVSELMLSVGFSAHYSGYSFLREAVMISVKNDGCHMVTKDVYPAVARMYNVTPIKVERAIRTVIDGLWSNGGEMRVKFLRLPPKRSKKPSNSEMIASLAEYIRLSEGRNVAIELYR